MASKPSQPSQSTPAPKPPEQPQRQEPGQAPSIAQEAESIVAALPTTRSRDDVSDQVVVPNYANCPPALRKRFQLFDRPMGEGPPVGHFHDPKYVAALREFLVGHGWEEIQDDLWRDPMAADPRGKKELAVVLKEKDRKTDKPVMQLVFPPGRVRYTLLDAVATQRYRNANEEGRPPTPLEQIEAMAKESDAVRRQLMDIVNELRQIKGRKVPETKEQLTADANVMRRVIGVAAERLKGLVQGKQEEAA